MTNRNQQVIPWLATALTGVVGIGCVLAGAQTVQAQDRYAQDRHDTVTCSSTRGRRATCQADTRRGVTLVRELRGSRCEEGFSWGYNRREIWVDRGCRAEFSLNDQRYPVNLVSRVEPGTTIPVRTNESIDTRSRDGRIYYGRIVDEVRGSDGQVAIPRGSDVELTVRRARDNDLILDIESITAYGQRYAIDTQAQRLESSNRDGVGANRRTGEFIGGGAVLGTILGAIAGGGKGAAIGAAAGAAAGAGGQVLTQGRNVRVPAESIITFRLDQPLVIDTPDNGYTKRGTHYHRDQDQGR
jgi:Protein of unknown function (DUF3011)